MTSDTNDQNGADGPPKSGDHPSWACPICTTPVPHVHRPGRVKIYCSNSCKQKAYRWRRRRRAELQVADPPERAHSLDKIHALRADHDLITPHTYRSWGHPPRRVTACGTACGTAAIAARDRSALWSHTKFYARADLRSPDVPSADVCSTCVTLSGTPLRPLAEVLQLLSPLQRRAHRRPSAA